MEQLSKNTSTKKRRVPEALLIMIGLVSIWTMSQIGKKSIENNEIEINTPEQQITPFSPSGPTNPLQPNDSTIRAHYFPQIERILSKNSAVN